MTVQELLDALDANAQSQYTNAEDQMALLVQLRAQLVASVPTTNVANSAELAAALPGGGVIILAPNTYIGRWDITVPGTVLRGAILPTQRVNAGDTAAYVLKSSDQFKPALKVLASNVSVEGITFERGHKDTQVILVGSSTETIPTNQPDNVVLDRIEVPAPVATGGWRAIEAHTRSFQLLRSRITEFWYQGRDSQAFYSTNGPGPYLISDNHLEASGENVLFGGGSIRTAAMHPRDVTISGNTIFKPQTWRQLPGSVKNSVEFKSVINGIIEDNIIDGCWKDAQVGSMILLTPRNQNNDSPWAQVKDIIIRNNRTIRHTNEFAVNILYTDDNHVSLPTENITIEFNLFQDSPKGVQIGGGVGGFFHMNNNTLPATKGMVIAFDFGGQDPTVFVKPDLIHRNNVELSGNYGVSGKGTTPGKPSLDAFCVIPYDFTGNIIEKTAARAIAWPAGNTLLAPNALAGDLDSQFHYIPDSSKGY